MDGSRLRRFRENAGMSLTGLAAAASVSKSFLSMIERGQREPSPTVTARLAQALGLAVADLRDPDS